MQAEIAEMAPWTFGQSRFQASSAPLHRHDLAAGLGRVTHRSNDVASDTLRCLAQRIIGEVSIAFGRAGLGMPERLTNPRLIVEQRTARVSVVGQRGTSLWFVGVLSMKVLSGLKVGLLVLATLIGAVSMASAADGSIRIRILKAGFVVGGSGGDGVLTFQGRRYPVSVGGVSYGFTFGASETRFHGRVRNIRRPSDISGVYAQGGAGAALGRGAQVVVLTNQNGVILELTGEQKGVIVSLDLSGLALSLK